MSLFSLDEVKALSEQSSPGNAAVPVKDIFAEKQRAGWHKPPTIKHWKHGATSPSNG